MNADLNERRRKMVKRTGMGLPLAEVVKDLASEYGVSTRALYADYANRKNWLRSLLNMQDPEAFFLDLWAKHKELERMTMIDYLKSPFGSNARIGALRLLRDLNRDFIELFTMDDLMGRIKALEEKDSK